MDLVADAVGRGVVGLRRFVLHNFDAAHQAFAANIADVRVRSESISQASQQVRSLLGGLRRKIFTLDDVERSQRDRAADGMSAVGVGVHPRHLAGVEHLSDPLAHADTTQREVAGRDRLRELNQVGLHAPVIQAPHCSRAAEAGDDFVGCQQYVVLSADLADAWEVIVGRDDHSAGSLHGLGEEHRDGLRSLTQDRLFEFIRGGDTGTESGGGDIAIRIRRWDVNEAGNARLEHWPIGRDTGGCCRCQRVAVIAPLPRDDFRLLWPALHSPVVPSGLETGVARLAASRREEESPDRRRRETRQSLGQLNRQRIGTSRVAGAIRQRLHLLSSNLGKFLPAVTRDDVPQTGEPVDVFLAVGIDEDRPFAAHPDMCGRLV